LIGEWVVGTSEAVLTAAPRLDVRGGRIVGEAADAVLAAAGRRVRRRRQWPAGLTPREVEMLRLVARGASNKEIAHQLFISPKTAGTHIEQIYVKTGANSQAAGRCSP